MASKDPSTYAVVASASENAIDQKTSCKQSRNSQKTGARFQPKWLWTGRYMPRLFIWKTQRLRSKPGPFFRNIPDISIVALQTIFPKSSGYFDSSISRNICNISGKRSPKYSEYFEKMVGGCDSRTAFPKYFGKLVPTINEATMSSAHMPGVARTDLGKRSVGSMKRFHLPGTARTNFPKYPGFFGQAVRENARKCDEQGSRFRFIG